MIRFNIGIFNPQKLQIYISQLEVLLQSIWDLYQNTIEIAVFYENLLDKDIKEISEKFPHIILKYKKIEVEFNKDIFASRKMNMWYELYIESDKKRNVFMDSDMLLVKKIDHFFDNTFDIGYTHKTDKQEGLSKPINTGLILINKSEKIDAFMKHWRDKTNELLNSDDCWGGGWGAVDQHVLGEALGTKKIKKMNKIIIHNGIRFKGFPCKMLNNILSPSPKDPDLYVIHYKGSWRYVLTDGNWERSIRTSVEFDHELFDLWHKKLQKFNQ